MTGSGCATTHATRQNLCLSIKPPFWRACGATSAGKFSCQTFGLGGEFKRGCSLNMAILKIKQTPAKQIRLYSDRTTLSYSTARLSTLQISPCIITECHEANCQTEKEFCLRKLPKAANSIRQTAPGGLARQPDRPSAPDRTVAAARADRAAAAHRGQQDRS